MSPKTRVIALMASITFLLSLATSPVVIRNQSMDFAVNHALAMGGGGGGGGGNHGGGGDHQGSGGHGAGASPGAGMDSGSQEMHRDMGTQQNPMSQGEMGQYGDGPMMSRQTIRSVQHNLNRLGFHAGPEDGIMGAQTQRAVTSYQTHMGMAPDGILTHDLANRIMAGSPASGAN